MVMRKGDMRFINNHAILHSREAFQDGESSNRHLIRMWLQNEQLGWGLPAALKACSDVMFAEDAGAERWEVIPTSRVTFSPKDRVVP
jgi:hypothetical protein